MLLLAWTGIGAATAAILRLRSPASTYGLAWFAVNLLPVVGIVPIPSAEMAERYLYLPAIGLWLVAGDLFARGRARVAWRPALTLGGAAIVALLAVLTVRRNPVWRDPITFYSAMAEAEPGAVLARFSLGLAHLRRGDAAAAIPEWEAAAQIDPTYFDVAGQLGALYARAGDLGSAARWLQTSVRAGAAEPAVIYNLARVQDLLGNLHEAAVHYSMFIERSPPELEPLARKARARLEQLGVSPPP
jgi:tetratricopeptide (TPR) repeat protein